MLSLLSSCPHLRGLVLVAAVAILAGVPPGRCASLPATPPCVGECATIPKVCRFHDTYPKQYVAYRTTQPPSLDGRLDDPLWGEVAWSDEFVDIQGPGLVPSPPRFDTQVKMRWDDKFLYIAARLQEPQVWANITKGPDVIFHDNDFEVFVDPAGSNRYYKEFEVNANAAQWALCLNRPYSDGGYENSSRVMPNGWSMPAAVAAAAVDGCKVNDASSGSCRGWTVEVALPLADLAFNTTRDGQPVDGELWRINFSRVEWRVEVVDGKYQKLPGAEDNWVWSPMGQINMHAPERWGYLQFAAGDVNGTAVIRDAGWTLREVAMTIFHAQKRHKEVFGFYAMLTEQLDPFVDRPHVLDGKCTLVPKIFAFGDYYFASVKSLSGAMEVRVDAQRRLEVRQTGNQ
mmetsp:Transcript_33899/g.66132  ORF Transcript_33899/g.66132 Transcript_33899/m.66132 type:complete len:401 (-) Transcript_33899:300-1502(-)|eukprot:CAMPEP_0173388686 /NCGR_PEP_ID=MMETSP1356-20130122/10934_1 /TAXON_ID=77927 ORGANISM="Hemiselmis virescens, Strain PCC157" /NCGR_SAMPLE_ID=MMETSP1356 /ASSEMBLY_ACC=CAM_ASM_000847 /LENGTH=400 /DNA_ID=CAMNT_0014345651 /DNA_START=309 /DNA_END=1511 /DNA_ORIENTATION=-